MVSITTRAGKGSPLTTPELDANFTALKSAVEGHDTALSGKLSADGTVVPTAALPMAGFTHTGVGAATTRTEYGAVGQVQDGAFTYAGVAGGTANALTATLTPAPSAVVAGMSIRLRAAASNSSASVTLNLNSTGSVDIKRPDGTALLVGDIASAAPLDLFHNGTYWLLLNPQRVATPSVTDNSTSPINSAWVQGLTASDTRAGIQENATGAEYKTGTATDRTLTVAVARANNTVLETVITASGTSVDFTTIPDWAKTIIITIVGLSTNGTSVKMVRLGDSGGFESTGYLSSTAFQQNGLASAVANYTDGFSLSGVNAADVQHGTIVLRKHTGNTWVCDGNIGFSSGAAHGHVAGSKATSGTLTSVQVTTQGGTDTFDAGTVAIAYF